MSFKLVTSVFLAILLPLISFAQLIDLEEVCSNFVLETKQIIIPEFPGALNPSIVKWDDKILMSFRFRGKQGRVDQIGLVYLDQNLNLSSHVIVINQSELEKISSCPLWTQDPRLIAIQSKLYMVFNNVGEVSDLNIRRSFISEIILDEQTAYLSKPVSLLEFEGENPKRHEKNWTPFNYNGEMHLVYSIFPHKIFKPICFTHACETIATTNSSFSWKWGEPRGGSSATLEGDEYLSFFHSCCSISSVHSQGEKRDHYFMGAYMFSSTPPFSITRMSQEPIVGKNFYNGPFHKPWKPLHVVFPGGHICNEKFIWIAYGRQDYEVWIVKIDKKQLLDSLIPSSLTQSQTDHSCNAHNLF